MRYCYRCDTDKPVEAFGVNRAMDDGLMKFCKECANAYLREWKLRNPGNVRTHGRAEGRKGRASARAHVNAIKSGPCMDCGGVFPPCAMDFDHVRGHKVDDISRQVSRGKWSIERIDEEIAKCDLVCSNCHRVRTNERRLQGLDGVRRIPQVAGSDGLGGFGGE